MSEDGQDVSESTDLLVLDLIRRRDGWVVRYMTFPERPLADAPR